MKFLTLITATILALSSVANANSQKFKPWKNLFSPIKSQESLDVGIKAADIVKSQNPNKNFMLVTADENGRLDKDSVALSYEAPEKERYYGDNNHMVQGFEVGNTNYAAFRLGQQFNRFVRVLGMIAGSSTQSQFGLGVGFGAAVEISPLQVKGLRGMYVSGRYVYILDQETIYEDQDTGSMTGAAIGYEKKFGYQAHWFAEGGVALNKYTARDYVYPNLDYSQEPDLVKTSTSKRGWYFAVGINWHLTN
ncbi:MAG: hypothetical protein AB7F59_06130 [Bdellovibrionales bacterium]